jgi:hypothetical protein
LEEEENSCEFGYRNGGKEEAGGCEDSPHQTSNGEATLSLPEDDGAEHKKCR